MTTVIRRQTAYLLLAISLGHIILISAQVQSRKGIPVLQATTFGIFAKAQQMLAAMSDGGRSVWTHYFALRGVQRENEDLRRQVLTLQGQVQQLQAESAQTTALERALALRQTIGVATVSARVIAGGPSPGSLAVTIDRGADDGVQPDMAVIGPNGVVGRVINTPLPHAAQVQLLVDHTAHAGVYFERTGAGGIVGGGAGNPALRVDYVPASADVKAGDRVLTSGQDNLYPRGFFVGIVERAERKAGVWNVGVRPAVDFSHVDIVLVILTRGAVSRGGAGRS